MKTTKTFYKIRNTEGLYSTGGYDPRFAPVGYSWARLKSVYSHINDHNRGGLVDVYKDCEIIECELVVQVRQTVTSVQAHLEKRATELREAMQRSLEHDRNRWEALTPQQKAIMMRVQDRRAAYTAGVKDGN